MNECITLKSREFNIEGKPEATTRFNHTSTQPDMSETMTNKETEMISKKGRLSITDDEVHVMTLVRNDGVQRLLKISFPLPLGKIRDAAGSGTVD